MTMTVRQMAPIVPSSSARLSSAQVFRFIMSLNRRGIGQKLKYRNTLTLESDRVQ